MFGDRTFRSLARIGNTDATSADLRLPANITLRPYQLEGAAWLYEHKRGILGDDAGLGKTLQAAAAAVKPVLVTCPTYLVLQWADVLAQEYPDDTVSVAGVGSRMQRHRGLSGGGPTTMIGKSPADWVIVNTDMHRGYPMPTDICTWIVDEAHHFRNRDAERTKLAQRFARSVERVYELTATPVYKDVTNLWSLLHMVDPKEYASYWDFFQQYAKTSGDGGWGGSKVIGIWNPKKLERELQQYLLRRTYRDVNLFLPDVIDKDVVLEFGDAEKKLYRRVRDNYVYEDIPLSSQAEVMHTLRRCTVHAKIDAAQQILEDDPGVPTVIFCWYRDTAEDCAAAVGGLVIHGDMSADDRPVRAKEAIAKGVPVCATISAMSEGVDLSACKQVIQLEEDYVPGSMYQERRRFQRWTPDERPILIHNVRVKDTIDMDVHRSVVARRGSTQQILKDALT